MEDAPYFNVFSRGKSLGALLALIAALSAFGRIWQAVTDPDAPPSATNTAIATTTNTKICF